MKLLSAGAMGKNCDQAIMQVPLAGKRVHCSLQLEYKV